MSGFGKSLLLLFFNSLAAASVTYAQSFDLLFVVDETGNMGAEIAHLQAYGSTAIAPEAVSVLGDVAFGVAGYRDFPVSPYGETGDLAYQLHTPVSSDTILFQVGLNALTAGGGGDFPEASLHALDSVATSSPGWRPGSIRVILWIGNAPGHDGDLEPDYAACCSSVGVTDVVADLLSANIVVFALSTGGLDATGQASAVTSVSGGTLTEGLLPGALADAIVALIDGPIHDLGSGAGDPPPVPDGAHYGGTPMLVGKDPNGIDLEITWDVVSCPAYDYNMFHGDLEQIASLTYSGAVCGLGLSGQLTWTPPAGSVFWILASVNGVGVESGHGYGLGGMQRLANAGVFCGVVDQSQTGGCP